MIYIGNILTDKNGQYNELLNVTKDKSGLIDGIPTLVVGWEFTKSNYPDVDIIDRKVCDGVYWTFGNRERRDRYESDVKWFTEECFQKLTKSVEYKFINILKDGVSRLNDFIKDSFSYINGGMVYMYDTNHGVVYGVSLRDVEYIGMDVKKFMAKVYRQSKVVQFDESMSYETKKMLYGNSFVVPYIFSK